MPSTIINFAFIFGLVCAVLNLFINLGLRSALGPVDCRAIECSLSKAYGPRHSINLPSKPVNGTRARLRFCAIDLALHFARVGRVICHCFRLQFILQHIHSFYPSVKRRHCLCVDAAILWQREWNPCATAIMLILRGTLNYIQFFFIAFGFDSNVSDRLVCSDSHTR